MELRDDNAENLESTLAKKNWTELLENQQQKDMILVGLCRDLKTWGEILPLTETIDWIEVNKEMTSPFAKRMGEKLGSLIDTIISNIP